jgi:hypothetical protein
MNRLVSESGTKALRFYGAVYPRDRLIVHAFVRIMNLIFKLKRSEFRSYVHSPAAIAERLRGAGLELVDRRHSRVGGRCIRAKTGGIGR